MQMVKRIVGGFFLFILLLWLLAPKQEFYYLLEKSLKKSNIVISNETITDTWIGIKIDHADIYIEGAKIASNKELNFIFLFLYAKLSLDDLEMVIGPKKIEHFTATYSILNPLKVILKGRGSIGEIDGNIFLKERRVEILFSKPKNLETIKKFLKRDAKKGWYYEKTY